MHFDTRIPLMIELGFSQSEIPRLRKYIDLLWASNEELNLISRKMTFEELIDNHLIDCLLPLKQFPQVKVAADFGSGGGLPGVVYAIQFPQTTFNLFEKSPKKQEFLRKCQVIAPNLKINAEIPQQDLKNVEIVTARAFKPVDVILDMSRGYYERGGKYFLLKGRKEKIDEEMVLAKKKFKDVTAKIEVLHSPLLEVERHLVLIP